MKEVNELVELSRYAGERFDLVQAAGGNTSVKLDNGQMIIKASGYTLSEVTKHSGFSTVATKQVAEIVKNDEILNLKSKREREHATSSLVKAATIDQNNRPSIETLLHSLLLKYTLHTHAIAVNIILSKKDYIDILKTIFTTEYIVIVDYKTPGIELAIELDKELQKFNQTPNIIFLKNHGLIITSNAKDDIKELNEKVLRKVEGYLNINMSKYKLTNRLSSLLNSVQTNDTISYLSEDSFLYECLNTNRGLFFTKPFCPDTLVYCGINAIEIQDFTDQKQVRAYTDKYVVLPKVVICKDHILFSAQNLKKAREMEEVFKFHLMVLSQNKINTMNFLELDELAYLSNWEAEKFRQNL